MGITLSRRKLESYQRAEVLAREIRYQLQSDSYRDENRLADFCIHWMRATGNIKYERPGKAPKINVEKSANAMRGWPKWKKEYKLSKNTGE